MFELRRAQSISTLDGTYATPLLGRHQVDNAAVAIAALDLLRHDRISLRASDVRQGVANVRWPGRFEILCQDPVLVVDCAHNGDSAAKLATALTDWFPDERWTFIIGASTDKDVPGILRALAPRVGRIIATHSRHPRAMPPQSVVDVAAAVLPVAGAPHAKLEVANDVATALELALGLDETRDDSPHLSFPAQHRGSPICVTGSIFVVAEAREFWALYSVGALAEMARCVDSEALALGYDLVYPGASPRVALP